MAYSRELIEEVKELYPNVPTMHELAEEGNVWLGRYLDDHSQGCMSVDVILKATSLKEIKTKAELLKKKGELYIKWCEEDPRKEERSL